VVLKIVEKVSTFRIKPEHIVAVFFFIAVFLFYSHPIKLGDVWWHLATGRWIVEHGQLPPQDPLTFTTTGELTARMGIYVKGHWASQVIYFLVYKISGFRGLVIFNALFFVCISLVLWRLLRRKGIDVYTSILTIVPVILLLAYYDEIRSQSFSFFFSLIIFCLLDRGLQDLNRQIRHPKAFMLMPVIMVLWANTHPGVIVGYIIMAAFFLNESIVLIKNRGHRATLQRYRVVMTWLILAALATLLNPNFISLITVSLMEYSEWSHYEGLIEQMSPWAYSRLPGKSFYFYTFTVIYIVTATILAFSWRRLKLPHILLYIAFGYAASSIYRMAPFFALISMAIASSYMQEILSRLTGRIRPILVICIIGFSSFLVFDSYKAGNLTNKTFYDEKLPVKAVSFIKENNLEQPLFNPYNWGGYISWVLYPHYKVFLTSNIVDLHVTNVARIISTGDKNAWFEKYRIKTVIYDPVHIIGGHLSALVLSLLKDDNWRLVYFDSNSSIFAKAGSSPHVPSIDKQHLWNALISYAESEIRRAPESDKGYFELAGIYFAMEKWDKASEALSIANEIKARNTRK
jgi:hypothetical protein